VFFDAINRFLEQCGHMMKGGTIVDATLISAPSSTKNQSGERGSDYFNLCINQRFLRSFSKPSAAFLKCQPLLTARGYAYLPIPHIAQWILIFYFFRFTGFRGFHD